MMICFQFKSLMYYQQGLLFLAAVNCKRESHQFLKTRGKFVERRKCSQIGSCNRRQSICTAREITKSLQFWIPSGTKSTTTTIAIITSTNTVDVTVTVIVIVTISSDSEQQKEEDNGGGKDRRQHMYSTLVHVVVLVLGHQLSSWTCRAGQMSGYQRWK